MAKYKNTNDNTIKYLFSFYKKSSYSSDLERQTNYLIDMYHKEKTKKEGYFSKYFKPLPVTAFALSIMILVLFFTFNPFFRPDNSIIVKNLTDNTQAVNKTENILKFDTNDGKKLEIRTPSCSFILKEKSIFDIDNSKKAQNKTDYFLHTGEVFVSADHLKKGENLIINTPYGKALVLGTKFYVTVSENLLKVTCVEGKVEVQSAFLKNNTIIQKNEEIIISAEEKSQINNENNKTLAQRTERLTEPVINKNETENQTSDKRIEKQNKFAKINNDIIENKKVENKKSKPSKIPTLQWQTKLEQNQKIKEILSFKNYTACITKGQLFLFDKEKGGLVKTFELPKNTLSFTTSSNSLAIYTTPGQYNIYTIPTLELNYTFNNGSIGKNNFTLNDKYIAIASLDKNLYIYDIKNKSLLTKFEFETPLKCTPLIIDNQVIVNESKTIYSYSIKEGKILWEYENNNNILEEKPIVDDSKKHLISYDEDGKGLLLNLETGKLKYTFKTDKRILPKFVITKYFLAYNSNYFYIYENREEPLTKSKIHFYKDVLNFYEFNKTIYLLTQDEIAFYDENKILNFNTKIDKFYLYHYSDNSIYFVRNDNYLIKYEL